MTAAWRAGDVRPPDDAGRDGVADEACFARAAVRMAGQAGILFGWGPDRFWAATPAELAALVAVIAPDDGAPLGPGEMAAMRERDPDGR